MLVYKSIFCDIILIPATVIDDILPADFTILTVPNILKRYRDPWKDILEKGQDLGKILDNLSPISL